MSPSDPNAAAAADDAELVRQLDRGDSRAAQALYQRYVGPLLRFAVAIGGCRQSAEDAVHDTFIELLRHPARFDPRRGSLSAFLFSIARHRMARLARAARRNVRLDLEPANGSTASDEQPATRLVTSEDEGERAHSIEQVRAAILALPLLHREIIALCDLEELPYAEVALILSCPLGTVRSRLHRARAQLAQQLQSTAVQYPMKDGSSPDIKSREAPPASCPELTAGGDAAALLSCRGSVT